MRVLQIVTVLSRVGEYGGPSTVAVNQATALAARGHEVTLVGGRIGDAPHLRLPGVTVLTFPVTTIGGGRSFTRICAPGMLKWLRSNGTTYDAVHIHAGRELVAMPAARMLSRLGCPVHVQTHGMIKPRNTLAHRLFDATLVRPVLGRAQSVFFLNDTERATLCAAVGTGARYVHLPNGVLVDDHPDSGREAGHADLPEVLFLARLHERKRPRMFAEVAAGLIARGTRARFTLVGPDEGEADAVDRIIGRVDASKDGSLQRESAVPGDQVVARLARAAVYVLPAINEPVGMTVLEAMSAGLPVIVTLSGGVADTVQSADAGIVVDDDDPEQLSAAIVELLADPVEARAKGRRGRDAVLTEWSMDAVSAVLEQRYGSCRKVRPIVSTQGVAV